MRNDLSMEEQEICSLRQKLEAEHENFLSMYRENMRLLDRNIELRSKLEDAEKYKKLFEDPEKCPHCCRAVVEIKTVKALLRESEARENELKKWVGKDLMTPSSLLELVCEMAEKCEAYVNLEFTERIPNSDGVLLKNLSKIKTLREDASKALASFRKWEEKID